MYQDVIRGLMNMNEKLKQIKEEVLKCQKCKLNEDKTNYVFGEGSDTADIVFIGEAPGSNEDKTGVPFCGRAGEILNELLSSIGLNRDSIYICNILKCRPPDNRNPKPNEITACTPYLDKQIEIINPKTICCLGNFATEFIMKKFGLQNKIEGISKLHGKIFKASLLTGVIKIVPLYHPAVATYNPDMKRFLLEDFKVLKK